MHGRFSVIFSKRDNFHKWYHNYTPSFFRKRKEGFTLREQILTLLAFKSRPKSRKEDIKMFPVVASPANVSIFLYLNCVIPRYLIERKRLLNRLYYNVPLTYRNLIKYRIRKITHLRRDFCNF